MPDLIVQCRTSAGSPISDAVWASLADSDFETVRAEEGRMIAADGHSIRLGGWELLGAPCEGTLAQVYLARPASSSAVATHAAYAVKVLRHRWESDPRAIACLQREAEVAEQIADPRVISVLAASLRRAPYFLVLPWLHGATLREVIGGHGAPPLHVALWFVRQAATALDALHSAGWMHGDIKPANLMVSPEGHVTLLDLGFARRPEEQGSVADRCVVGTAAYLAPELLTSACAADIRSDIYSLGVVLYELLAGRAPFAGVDLADLIAQHYRALPRRLTDVAPHVPPEIARLVHQMLAKDPLRRPQTPNELVEQLVHLEIETLAAIA